MLGEPGRGGTGVAVGAYERQAHTAVAAGGQLERRADRHCPRVVTRAERMRRDRSVAFVGAVVAGCEAHVAEHPWREDAWGLLALALYRTGRQADALAVLRRARTLLVEQLALDPGPALQRLEADILNHADHLAPPQPVDELWARAAADYDRTVAVVRRLRAAGVPVTITLAPEAAAGRIAELAATGAVVSLGHSDASADAVRAALAEVESRAEKPPGDGTTGGLRGRIRRRSA